MNKQEIKKQILEDIKGNVYLYFPKLKSRLSYIAGKLGSNMSLTIGEKKTLEGNEYIPKYTSKK